MGVDPTRPSRSPSWTHDRPLLFGHRGASAELPENTIPAFARALELGANALESDVHLTRDGHVVMSHDADGVRTAHVDRPIAASSLAEVKAWDAGLGGQRPGEGFSIPTLHEFYEAFPEVLLNLDIKQTDPLMVKPLLRVIRDHGAEERTCVASFSAANRQAVLDAGYRGPVALGHVECAAILTMPTWLLKRAAFVRRGPRRAQVPVRVGRVDLAERGFVRHAHAVGVAVDFWTVNEADEARRLLAVGADGIMTDDVGEVSGAMPTER